MNQLDAVLQKIEADRAALGNPPLDGKWHAHDWELEFSEGRMTKAIIPITPDLRYRAIQTFKPYIRSYGCEGSFGRSLKYVIDPEKLELRPATYAGSIKPSVVNSGFPETLKNIVRNVLEMHPSLLAKGVDPYNLQAHLTASMEHSGWQINVHGNTYEFVNKEIKKGGGPRFVLEIATTPRSRRPLIKKFAVYNYNLGTLWSIEDRLGLIAGIDLMFDEPMRTRGFIGPDELSMHSDESTIEPYLRKLFDEKTRQAS